MLPTIVVRAGAGHVMRVTEDGQIQPGRYVGRASNGDPLPDGESVPDTSYYRRRIDEGSLTLVTEGTP